MADEELASLGVQVQSVSRFEADVAAAADAAAESAEAADFAERDGALAKDIGDLTRDLKTERGKVRPDSSHLRSLQRKLETAQEKRSTLASAHEARRELAAALLADAAATVVKPDAQDKNASSGAPGAEVVARLATETEREYDIRTGKITPLQKDSEGAPGYQRRQRVVIPPPVTRKRARAAIRTKADDEESCKANSEGEGGAGEEEDQASGSEFEVGSLDDDERDFDSVRTDDDDDDDSELAADPADDPEEVVIDGDLALPAATFDKLFEYQRTGLKWLLELHNQQAGGVLADEMGLGKTVQVVAFLAALDYSDKLPGPAIVVAPATVLKQWARHLNEWWPRFHVRILHPSSTSWDDEASAKKRRRAAPPKPEYVVRDVAKANRSVLVTTYEQVRKHQDLLLDKFEYVILDEGHKIRNPDADITLTCKRFMTPRRILLTGTPMQNNLKELWSVFDFVFPGRLGTLVVFEAQFSVPIAIGGYANASRTEVYTAYRCAATLRNLVSPFLLRRMKSDVALQLPEKQEQVLFCRLTPEQRQAYQHFLGSRTVRLVLNGHLNLFAAITALRQICNHVDIATMGKHWEGPKFCEGLKNWDDEEGIAEATDNGTAIDTDFGNPTRSGKFIVLETVLANWHKAGNRVLIFSQTHVVLDILSGFAEKRGYEYRRMDGKTAVGKRMALIDEFNNESHIFLFLLSTKVGGLGTNLCGADRVVLFDPDWNPATDLQARERAWRVGQKKSVIIYRLVTSGTIEEKILQRQMYKSLLSSKVLSDPRQRRFFRRKDMKDLFTLADEKDSGTETGDLFRNTGADEVRNGEVADPEKSDKDAEASGTESTANMLKSLFNSSDCGNALQSAMNHDAMMTAGTTDVDVEVLQHETEKVVSKAVEAINRSARDARRERVGTPTWTGRSGLAGIPVARPSTGGRGLGVGGGGGGGLLQQIKKRVEPQISSSSGACVPDAASSVTDLMRNVVEFLKQRDGVASSDDMISRFNGEVGAGGQSVLVFKTTLKRVATLKKRSGPSGESVWHLRASYKDQ